MKSIIQNFSGMFISTGLVLFCLNTAAVEREGVWRDIDPQKAQDLLEWAITSKSILEDGKVEISKLPQSERHSAYRALMEKVVETSGTKQNELLMRVALNRGLTVDEILSQTTKNTEPSENLQRRLLKEAIELAIRVHQNDVNFLSGMQRMDVGLSSQERQEQMSTLAIPQAKFEIEYAKDLKEVAHNSTSHEGTYQLLKFTLAQLYNGLNNSLHRRSFARVITKISEAGANLPVHVPVNTSEALTMNRNLKAALDDIVSEALKVRIDLSLLSSNINPKSCGTNKLGMSFSCIPKGTMVFYDKGLEKDIKLSVLSNFEIQTTEVTQQQWMAVMGTNPSHLKGEDHPVEMVSWDDTQSFIEKLNQRKDGYRYRLPAEVEWEYAARAGLESETIGNSRSEVDKQAWYSDTPTAVAQLMPNRFGLYDVIGNVWEWVQTKEVARGGSFLVSNWKELKFSSSVNTRQDERKSYSNIGFRLVRTKG